ncbi:MAG: apolipoprotein N-acyltransferase, partial [Verrucomicrobiota bacterium]|nr:apolipoprotein N-acyltransferase [Verrucomicrobiota bacterium]
MIDRIRTFLECHPKRAAFLAGLTAAVSMPPFGFFPGLWIAYPTLLIIALTRKNVLSAIGAGWLFGFGFFLASLYWITNALLVEADNWWWAVPFAVVVLPATLALYPAVAAGLFRVLLPTGLRAVALFVVLFMLTEWARGHFFTGFPWNTPALAFAGCPFVPQSLAWFGNWGLSLLTVLAAATPAAIMLTSGRRALTCMTAGVLIVVALAVAGALRLPQTSADSHPDIRLRLVQPGIPQAEKWDNDKANSNFHKILRLSTRIGPEPVTHLIWPESAFTWIVKGKTPNLGAIGTVTPAGGVTLTGIVRHENGHYYNSIAAINEKGQMVAKYDKSHLVPFGEYFPLQNLLNLPSLTGGTTGYTEGPGPVVIDLPSLPPFAPLICYEIIFPGEVIPDTGTRPSWLLNAT